MSILDMTAIQNLMDLQQKTGKDILGSLSKLYIDTTPEIISKMKLLLSKKSYEELGREAHSLKSSSANIGARKIMELCKVIEYKILGEEKFSDEELSSLITQVSEVFPETIEELKKLPII